MRHPDGTYDLTVEDIYEIREKNYELTKNMTMEERVAYINKKGREAAIRMGIKIPSEKVITIV